MPRNLSDERIYFMKTTPRIKVCSQLVAALAAAFFSMALSSCNTHSSNAAYSVTRINQFTDEKGTYLTGASDASKNTFHAFVKDGKVIWTPHLPADATREFTRTLDLIANSKKLNGDGTLNIALNNLTKATHARTEKVELLRYSLYTLSILAINENLSETQVESMYKAAIAAYSGN